MVFGYIKRKQREFALGTIPKLVSYKCLEYSREEDYFTGCCDINLTNHRKTATYYASPYKITQRIIGKACISSLSSAIAKWKIRIDQVDEDNIVTFGLFDGSKGNSIMISTSGCIDSDWWENKSGHYMNPNEWIMGSGTVVTLILDLINYVVKIKVDDLDEEAITLSNVPREEAKYRFMAILSDNTTISILHYSTHGKE